ncbi:uncharacterized protein LOC131234923 isoform X2 [Magnolia sinica]|uniref:uncharacterized protein LOC131234923 isoform X2 n=1 Tax=Magnolia sinica TaxID=86752 RepID=UPI00265AD387|nr:uncharacterized protein LOC131234923 isoform X2 [Magnolia sinica]
MEEEIERREAALAASPALQPKFQSSGVSQDQLKKLQELRKRRLQIKQRSKIQKNSKGGASGATKACEKGLSINDGQDEHAAVMPKDSSSSTAKANTSLMGEQSSRFGASYVFCSTFGMINRMVTLCWCFY